MREESRGGRASNATDNVRKLCSPNQFLIAHTTPEKRSSEGAAEVTGRRLPTYWIVTISDVDM